MHYFGRNEASAEHLGQGSGGGLAGGSTYDTLGNFSLANGLVIAQKLGEGVQKPASLIDAHT